MMIAHPRDFVQPELQSVEGCVRVETQCEDVLEAMDFCAVKFFNRIDTTETMQYSMQGCCIGRLRVDELTNNGDYIVEKHTLAESLRSSFMDLSKIWAQWVCATMPVVASSTGMSPLSNESTSRCRESMHRYPSRCRAYKHSVCISY